MNFSSLVWSIPFLGIIFSVSFMPLLAKKIWNRYYGFVPAFWSVVYLLGVGYEFGATSLLPAILKPLLEHYIPFVTLIFALYTTSGGIFIEFSGKQGPLFNTCFLFCGSMVAGWIGTTGAAMLLVRPFLRVNSNRKHKTHLLVFFIFLVANIGGALTPLGDPPLFIGFLEGVDFFWFAKNLGGILLSTVAILCALFFVIDTVLFNQENVSSTAQKLRFTLVGYRNIPMLALILVVVTLCSFNGSFYIAGEQFSSSELVRSLLMVVIAVLSLKITPEKIREKNSFSMEPLKEVAGLFAGIFITVVPIIHMLHQGASGEFQRIFSWISPGGEFVAANCFWASGLLSAILDNAPTFLIFFHLVSGDAVELMTVKSHLLTAISVATVFMGALTYIGNAPNLMVKSVWESHRSAAPSFSGYMIWSFGILIPLLFLISLWL
ncbi:MAG: sodium:proton antiporter [Holosporaceae bacterium]|jgi:Na+/H+ antiporter NhaD/arsenite permease-like protein|nr:sodium:proton antiporter [Holosporaceae bacterium]